MPFGSDAPLPAAYEAAKHLHPLLCDERKRHVDGGSCTRAWKAPVTHPRVDTAGEARVPLAAAGGNGRHRPRAQHLNGHAHASAAGAHQRQALARYRPPIAINHRLQLLLRQAGAGARIGIVCRPRTRARHPLITQRIVRCTGFWWGSRSGTAVGGAHGGG